ncbi:hypothetical protein AK830_g1271 [Neonectria ditissima]|uniref:Uncharacterized protein n=1 Tax=Neonectria ditissima TaxID=78410 RepID=A0A0P7BJB6_9HYPO|nr:hypothetical protein AK830_g1271 [Neonectria ditissima]
MALITSDRIDEQPDTPSITTKSTAKQTEGGPLTGNEKAVLAREQHGRGKSSTENDAETAEPISQKTQTENPTTKPIFNTTKSRRRRKPTTESTAQSQAADEENTPKEKSRKQKPRRVDNARESARGTNSGSPQDKPGFNLRWAPQQRRPAAMQSTPAKSKSGAPAIRLELNLDIEIQLKAKIRGDITLTLL